MTDLESAGEIDEGAGIPHTRRWLELSLAQRAVWVDARMTGPGSYLLGNWARIGAEVDVEAFRQSISLLMARHDALRLRVDESLPRQWMDASVAPPMTLLEFAPDADPDSAFREHVERAFARSMPLGDHALFHVDLIRGGESLYFMLWRFHHLIADSLSVWLTQRLWTGAYLALTSESVKVLEPPSSYLPVIASDESYSASSACQRDAAYWTARFEPLPPALMQRSGGGQAGMMSASSALSAEEVARVRFAAGLAGVSLQRALFALYAVALSVHFAQPDVVTGVALHRRDHGSRNTIGMFSGVLAVRCGFERTATLRECVRRFGSLMEADLRSQRLAVDEIARLLGLFRVGRARLYEATVSYLTAEHVRGDVELEGVPIPCGAVSLSEASPLSLHLSELEAGGMTVKLIANTLHAGEREAHGVHAIFCAGIERFAKASEWTMEQLAESVAGGGGDAVANIEPKTGEPPREEWVL